MIWRIMRVTRKGKRLRSPELMHNGVEAENRAEALQQYRAQYPTVKLEELEARLAIIQGPERVA